MTDSNPRSYVHAEVLGGVQRRRRWTPEEKLRMVEETFLPGNSVSRVARMHGVAPNQLFGWRRQAASGALTATRAGGEVVAASEYRALENQVRELQRMLGKNGDLGRMLGVDNAWLVNVIRALGNYGEVFDRSLTPIGIQRGPNALWTTPGGQQYAPPFR